VPHVIGYADSARLGQGTNACGYVHPVAGHAVALEGHVALVDADPKPQLRVVYQIPVNRQRAGHRVEGAGEARERLVSGRLDEVAVVPLDQRPDDGLVAVTSPPRGLLVPRHQGRVAHDVGEHDRGEAALGLLRGQVDSRAPYPGAPSRGPAYRGRDRRDHRLTGRSRLKSLGMRPW
jgi:hypothetical protein